MIYLDKLLYFDFEIYDVNITESSHKSDKALQEYTHNFKCKYPVDKDRFLGYIFSFLNGNLRRYQFQEIKIEYLISATSI